MSTRTTNRLCLAAAFLLNVVMAARPPFHGADYLLFADAAGRTLLAMVIGWVAKWLHTPPFAYHGVTLALAVLAAVGQIYAEAY